MNTVKAFQSKDGKLFDTKEKCVNHESIQEFKKMLDCFCMNRNKGKDEEELFYPSQDDLNEFARLFLKNRKKVQKIFAHFESVPRKKTGKK